MKIFDLHTHILPSVDDGAQSIEQALEMLRNAEASDIAAVAVTPHFNIPGQTLSVPLLEQKFAQLKQAAEDIPVELVPGAEVRVNDQLPQLLRRGKLPTLNGSRYLLTEFPGYYEEEAFVPVLRMILSAGYIPLVAHPERYSAVIQSPGIVENWLNMGCHIQLTGGSITGAGGRQIKKTAAILLQEDLVCCVASDAHGPVNRTNFLLDVYSYLCLYYSGQYARTLMWDNPVRICDDQTL